MKKWRAFPQLQPTKIPSFLLCRKTRRSLPSIHPSSMTNERPWLRVWLTYKFFKFGMMIGFDRRKFIDFFPFIKTKSQKHKGHLGSPVCLRGRERESRERKKKRGVSLDFVVFGFSICWFVFFCFFFCGCSVLGCGEGKLGFSLFSICLIISSFFWGKVFSFFGGDWGIRFWVVGLWVESATMNIMRRLKSIASGRTSISSDPVRYTFFFIIVVGEMCLFGCWENGRNQVGEEMIKFTVWGFWDLSGFWSSFLDEARYHFFCF